MKQGTLKICIDTSVISAFFDDRQPERQQLTKDVWPKLLACDVFVTDIAVRELTQTSDEGRKKQFLDLISGVQVLTTTQQSLELSTKYVQAKIVPLDAQDDATQLAIATLAGVDKVLSWNFRHMANLKTKSAINAMNLNSGFRELDIIPPAELL